MSRLCYPYGAGISCTCDGRKRILRCVPVVDALQGGQASQHQDTFYEEPDPLMAEETMMGRAGDERTEIILAATFLLMVILSFIAFIIHRCERSLYHRRQHCSAMPKSLSSVSIQTVPIMSTSTFSNGEIQTISRTMNGGPTRIGEDISNQDGRYVGDPPQPLYLYRQPSIQSRDPLPDFRQDSHLPTPQDPPHSHLPSQQDPHQFRLQCEEMVENMIINNDTLDRREYTKDQIM